MIKGHLSLFDNRPIKSINSNADDRQLFISTKRTKFCVLFSFLKKLYNIIVLKVFAEFMFMLSAVFEETQYRNVCIKKQNP